MRLDRQTRAAYAVMAGCVVAAALIRVLLGRGSDVLNTGRTIPFVSLLILALVVWMRLLRGRFVRREVSRCFLAIACLLALELIFQAVKYCFATEGSSVERYLWYAYYVPLSLVPALLLTAVLYVGRPQSWHAGATPNVLAAVGATLSLLVLTNDLHQLVFDLGGLLVPGVEYSASSMHSAGPLLYLIWAWVAVVGAAVLVVLSVRSVRVGLTGQLVVPLVVVAGMAAVLPLYGMYDRSFIEGLMTFPGALSISLVAFMESLVASGLFPANSAYEALWRASSLRGGFVDGAGRFVDASAGAPKVTNAQVEEALAHPVTLAVGEEELDAVRLRGGVAYWVRDLSRVRSLQRRLEGLGDTLAQEQTMLEAENALAHERTAVAQRQALYERVAASTQAQIASLRTMLDEPPSDEEEFLAEMRQAAVRAAYVKRCANLMFVGEDGTVDVRELVLALEESARCLRSYGVQVELVQQAGGIVQTEPTVAAYERFEQLVEGLPSELEAVSLTILRATDTQALELHVACRTAEGQAPCMLALPLGGDAL